MTARGVDANRALRECDRAVGLIGEQEQPRHRKVRLEIARTNRERALQSANRFLRPTERFKHAAVTARRSKVTRIERYGARVRRLREFKFALLFEHTAHAGVGVGERGIFRKQLAEDAQRGVIVVRFGRGTRVGKTRFFSRIWLNAQRRAAHL